MPFLNETDDFGSLGLQPESSACHEWDCSFLKLIAIVQSMFLTKMVLLQFLIAGACREGKDQIRVDTFKILLILGASTTLINETVPGYLEVELSDVHGCSSFSGLEYSLLKSGYEE